MKLLALLLCSLPIYAKPHWNVSVAFLVGTQVADMVSSRGGIESNPILGANRSFGARQIVIKSGLTGGLILGEWLIMRRKPKMAREWEWVNWTAGVETVGVVGRNLRVK